MFIIIHDDSGNICHIEPNGHTFTKDDVEIVTEIPPYIPQEGKGARLLWNFAEQCLEYEYYDLPVDDHATDEDYQEQLERFGVKFDDEE